MCVAKDESFLGASFEEHLIRSVRASMECKSEDCAHFLSARRGVDYSTAGVKKRCVIDQNLYEQPLKKSCPYKYLARIAFRV